MITPESEGWTEGHQANSKPDFYGKWINVEHELPPTRIEVIVFANDIVMSWVETASYSKEQQKWKDARCDGDQDYLPIVTHWMPLPEAPELEL